MNFILSLFLCFVLAFGGGSVPAQPETASTWTLHNVEINTGTDSYALNPEAHVTVAIGSEKSVLHFGVESEGKELLPISAEFTPDALRFALSGSGNVYSVTSEEVAKLLGFDEETAQCLDAFGDYLVRYGALLGAITTDEKLAMRYAQAAFDALFAACDGTQEPTEIEVDGEMLEGQHLELVLTPESCMKLLNALRDSDIPQLDDFLESTLKIMNSTSGTEYTDFTAFASELGAKDDFSIPLSISYANEEGLAYEFLELSIEANGIDMLLDEEIKTRNEETEINQEFHIGMNLPTADNAMLPCEMAMQMSAEVNPSEMRGEYIFSTDINGNQSQSSAEFHERETDGLISGDVNMEIEQNHSIETDGQVQEFHVSMEINATETQRLEEDGSVTTAVSLAFSQGDEAQRSLSFELSHDEGEIVDYFENSEPHELTAEVLNGTEESGLYTLFGADIMRLSADVLQLGSEESIAALLESDSLTTAAQSDGDAGSLIHTLEEASEIFKGEIPAYTPPEGYELKQIYADPYNLEIEYTSDENGFNLNLYSDPWNSQFYTFNEDTLNPIEGNIVQIEPNTSENSVYSAHVYPSNSGDCIDFDFYGNVSLNEATAIVNGLGLSEEGEYGISLMPAMVPTNLLPEE